MVFSHATRSRLSRHDWSGNDGRKWVRYRLHHHVVQPKPDLPELRNALLRTAAPATHAEALAAAIQRATPHRNKPAPKTQLASAHLSPDIGKQLCMIAAEEDTDVQALLIKAVPP